MKDLPVKQYIPRPYQCKRCYGFGHGKNKCKDKNLGARCCGWCGKDHHCTKPENECKGRDCETCQQNKCNKEANCLNCLGNHPAWNPQCPRMVEEQAIAAIMEEEKISHYRAKKVYEERQIYVQTTETKQSDEQKMKWFYEANSKNENTISDLQKQIHEMTTMLAQIVAILTPVIPVIKKLDSDKAAVIDNILHKLKTKYKPSDIREYGNPNIHNRKTLTATRKTTNDDESIVTKTPKKTEASSEDPGGT